MPSFKHPCPHCAKYILRDVAACPYCGQADPFAPARCQNCRATLEDPSWQVCPSCGQPLAGGTSAGAAAADQPAPPPDQSQAGRPASETVSPTPATTTTTSAGQACTGCAAPLAEGARFCTVCGTLTA